MPVSWTCTTRNISKNQNLYPQQSQITYHSVRWDTLYFVYFLGYLKPQKIASEINRLLMLSIPLKIKTSQKPINWSLANPSSNFFVIFFPLFFFLVLTLYLRKFWKNLTLTIVKIKTEFFKKLYRDSNLQLWNDSLTYFHLLRIQSKVTWEGPLRY